MPLSSVQLIGMLPMAQAPSAPKRTVDAATAKDAGFERILKAHEQKSDVNATDKPAAATTQTDAPDKAKQPADEPNLKDGADANKELSGDASGEDIVEQPDVVDEEALAMMAALLLETPTVMVDLTVAQDQTAVPAEVVIRPDAPIVQEAAQDIVGTTLPQQQTASEVKPAVDASFASQMSQVQDAGNKPAAAVAAEAGARSSSNGPEADKGDAALRADVLPMTGMQSDGTVVVSRETAPAAAPPPMAQDITAQIVERLTTTVTEGRTTCEIDLKPEFLGRLTITLTVGSEGLTARIRAQDQNVGQLIAGQMQELRTALQEQGVRVSEMEVVYDTFSNDMGQQADARHEARQEAARQGRRLARGGIEAFSEAAGYGFMAAVAPEETGVDITA